jgi:hypothetical protein
VSEYNGLLCVYTTITRKNYVSEYNGLLWVYTTITCKNCVSGYTGLWYTIFAKNKRNNSVLVITNLIQSLLHHHVAPHLSKTYILNNTGLIKKQNINQ